MNDRVSYWFEKMMAVVFLSLLVGMILFFNYVPLAQESKNVIMLILGVLVSVAKDAIPRIFGIYTDQDEEFKQRILQLESQVERLVAENTTLKTEYDKILKVLVDNYVTDNPSSH